MTAHTMDESLRRLCRVTGKQFDVPPEEAQLLQTFNLPLPDVTPEERLRARLAFYNERRFFWRTCDMSGARIYSVYPPKTEFPVYAPAAWWGDAWDGLDFGVDFDVRRPFFVQLEELFKTVPRPAISVRGVVDSRALHDARDVRNSFLLTSACDVDRCFYCVHLRSCEDCCDCDFISDCNKCYECLDCHGCRQLLWSEHCQGCSNSAFLSGCRNCSDCLFSANLDGRQYCFFNKQMSQAEYEAAAGEWMFTARPVVENGWERFMEFLRTLPVPHIYCDDESADCTGNYLYGCENIEESFECIRSNGLRYCDRLADARMCIDGFGFGQRLERAAHFVSVGLNARDILCCVECWKNVSRLTYCAFCENSSDLFGCVGLRGKEYCIFNKQLTREGYLERRTEIEEALRRKRVWGRFFPYAFSGFAYNISAANDYMPLNKVQGQVLQLPWDENEDQVKVSHLIDGTVAPSDRFAEVPMTLEELDGIDLRNLVFICEMTGKPFQIMPEELDLYHRLRVAPPARSSEQRHRERRMRLGPKRIYRRTIGAGDHLTSFPPDWKRPIVERQEWVKSRSQVK